MVEQSRGSSPHKGSRCLHSGGGAAELASIDPHSNLSEDSSPCDLGKGLNFQSLFSLCRVGMVDTRTAGPCYFW